MGRNKKEIIIVKGKKHQICARCKTIKPYDEFSYDYAVISKKGIYCKKCNSEKYYENKAWHQKFMHDYYKRNRDEIRAQQKTYYKRDPKKFGDIVKRYQAKNRN